MNATDIEWRANPPFTLKELIRKWRGRGYKSSWWRFVLGPTCTAEYWAKLQYDEMMDELEAHRRATFHPLIGPYWIDPDKSEP